MNVKTLQITCVTDCSACVTFQNRGPARARVSFITEVHHNLFVIACIYTKHIPAFLQLLSIFMVLQSSKSQSKEKENQSMKGQIALDGFEFLK